MILGPTPRVKGLGVLGFGLLVYGLGSNSQFKMPRQSRLEVVVHGMDYGPLLFF